MFHVEQIVIYHILPFFSFKRFFERTISIIKSLIGIKTVKINRVFDKILPLYYR